MALHCIVDGVVCHHGYCMLGCNMKEGCYIYFFYRNAHYEVAKR